MGNCEYNYKNKCKKDVCCLECKGKCEFQEDRCFTQDVYRNLILRGYPRVCKFYIKDGKKTT